MSLNIKITAEQGASKRVSLNGRLDTITAPELEVELDSLVAEAVQLIVFDMTDLEYISSAGLRVIFKATKSMKAKGGKTGILKMQPQIKKVFDIVKALPDVPIFKNDEEMDEYLSHMQQQVIDDQ
ncbi:STAS domain-containing protein [Oceanicoccus sagamiensis]|nr:STAS domain-containing protein [Oceanicoccus sagamiensis]